MRKAKSIRLLLIVSAIFGIFVSACSNDDEPVRMPDDIKGYWRSANGDYIMELGDENISMPLYIEHQNGEVFGKWGYEEVYYYEPGYNLVIYLTEQHQANVYQVVELTSSNLTWCWVDEIKDANEDNIGQIIGDIINKAQAGYKLDPSLYQYFNRLSEDQYMDFLNSLDYILYPWEFGTN